MLTHWNTNRSIFCFAQLVQSFQHLEILEKLITVRWNYNGWNFAQSLKCMQLRWMTDIKHMKHHDILKCASRVAIWWCAVKCAFLTFHVKLLILAYNRSLLHSTCSHAAECLWQETSPMLIFSDTYSCLLPSTWCPAQLPQMQLSSEQTQTH